MAEHCALYANSRFLPPLEALQALAPGAKVDVREASPDGTWGAVGVTWPEASLVLSRMRLGEKAFDTHLAAFLWSLSSRFRGGVDARSQALISRLTRAKHVLGCTALPNLESEPRLPAFLRSLAQVSHALISQGPVLYDMEGRVLLRDDLSSEPDAVVWTDEDAAARKQRSESKLQARGIPLQRTLPPIDGESEAWPRSAPEIALRCQALWVSALRGEGMPSERAVELLTVVGLWEAATPAERTFLKDPAPLPDAASAFTWGHEAVWVLLWALGEVQTLPWPREVCDVTASSRLLSDIPVATFVENASLRPVPEILDAADLNHRLFAATEQAQRSETQVEGVHPDVVFERERAFLWLLRFLGRPWDEVRPEI
jgi:hypothetical protein